MKVPRDDTSDIRCVQVGDDIDRRNLKDGAGRLGGLFQQADVRDLIGHRLLDDHFVLRVDGDLDIVADGDLGMGGHCPAVGIGQRYLTLAAPLQFRQQRPVATAFLARRQSKLARRVYPPARQK